MAHLALAEAAQEAFALDQVVLVLPQDLPHKRIGKPSVDERLQWLSALVRERPDRAVASCRTGLVIDVVRAFREELGRRCEIFVIAGRDAAERYATWDYGNGPPFSEQIKLFQLLVASRGGTYPVDPELAERILPFEIAARYDGTSSSKVREAIRSGTPWQHMVPPGIRDAVGSAYEGVRS
jgi:nicotinic acid mononucleotide adenylyltransferase